jgi:glycosyltransferase involved in cell wall biosynthesis
MTRDAIRILHAIDSAGIYGAETVLLSLASEQRSRGAHPMLLSMGKPGAPGKPIEIEARRRGIECVTVRMRGGPDFGGSLSLARIAREQRADVIHSHGYKANILLALLPRRRRSVPVITTLHGWTASRTWSKLGIYRLVDQFLLPRLDGVVIVNDQMRRLPALARLQPPPVTIPNGVAPVNAVAVADDTPLARSIAALRARCPLLLGVVGRLSPEKNVPGLIEALHDCKTAPHAGLVVLGDGPERAAIEGIITRLGLSDRVLLGGYVANGRDYLATLDVLVIPSLTEGLPMILLEAMAASLPIIATRVGDIPAVLGDLGLLVPPSDRAALAQAIATAASDLSRFRELGRRAAERVTREYGAAAMADRYSDVYQSVLARAGHTANTGAEL